MSNELFERAKPILDYIQHHGFEAYFVGVQCVIISWDETSMILILLPVQRLMKLKIF